MLEATNLTKRYNGVTALDSLTMTVEPGEVFCLLGANGAGKTTTINLFLNFIEPTGGTAKINGLDVVQQPLDTKKHVAYIRETVMLYRNLTGLENLEYVAALAGRPDYSRHDLLGFFREVGLADEAADRRVGTYSKGMRQKVGIAIALAKGARALLLDEPTSGLDPKASNEFSDLLRRMSDSGVAVLMATHDLFRAKESGTRVGIMKHGRLVAVHGTGEFGHADLEKLVLLASLALGIAAMALTAGGLLAGDPWRATVLAAEPAACGAHARVQRRVGRRAADRFFGHLAATRSIVANNKPVSARAICWIMAGHT